MTIAPEGITAIAERQFSGYLDVDLQDRPEFVLNAMEKEEFNQRLNEVELTRKILQQGIEAFEKDGLELRKIVQNSFN